MANSSGYKKYVSNTSWLFAEKIFNILMNLIITVWIARYLGPEQFGTLNYAIAFVSLFGILSSLGLNTLATKELLTHPQDSELIMGTSFALSFIGALILLPIAAFTITILRPDNDILFMMVLIIASGSIFTSLNIIKYWFESHVQAKHNVKVEMITNIITITIKAILLYIEAPLIAFAWVILVQSVLVAIGYVYMYLSKTNKLSTWKVSLEKIKYMLNEAYPLILTGAVFIFHTRIDQVMIGSMLGDEEVGIYAVAVRLSESWMFLPAVIAASFFPALLNAKKNNYKLYLQRIQHLLNLMALLGIFVAVIATFLASPFINLAFGEHYNESALILIIHIWSMVFYSISIISSRYFLAEGLQLYSLRRALIALVLNVVLNYFLIPIYGAVGAAIATVISKVVGVWLLNAINQKTRTMFYMQTKSLLLFGSFDTLRHIKNLRKQK